MTSSERGFSSWVSRYWLISVCWALSLCSLTILWLIIGKGKLPADPDAIANTGASTVGYRREVLQLDDRGTLVAEFADEGRGLFLRHVPRSGDQDISSSSVELDFLLADVRMVEGESNLLQLSGWERAGNGGAPTQVTARLALELPLGDELRVLPGLSGANNRGGTAMNSQSECPRQDRVPNNEDFLAASQRVGAELVQGLPPSHVGEVEITYVQEFSAHLADVFPGPDDMFRVRGRHVLKMSGVALTRDATKVWAELGQFRENGVRFQVELTVDGERVQNPSFEATPKLAFPDSYSKAMGATSPKFVYHFSVGIPEETEQFLIRVSYETEGREQSTGVHSWYYGVEDFGRQQRVSGGYEATVIWNSPLLTELTQTVPVIGSSKLLLEERTFLGSEYSELDGFGDEDQWWGFTATATADCPMAAVHYVPDLSSGGR